MPVTVKEYVLRCDWLPRFDEKIFSCDLRIAKPKPEIFLHCLSKLGVAAEDTLFLDDRRENVQAATELGMHGIVFTSIREAAVELASRFDMPAPLVDN